MRKHIYKFVVIPLMAFLGGFCAQALLSPSIGLAQYVAGTPSSTLIVAHPEKNNRGIQAQIGSDGQSSMFFFAPDSQKRLQFGTYESKKDIDLPMIGFNDNEGRTRMLVRLSGANQTPVIIMKDKQGRDRLTLGLSGTDKYESPYLTITDDKGSARNIF